jgi:stage V sporulation protein R
LEPHRSWKTQFRPDSNAVIIYLMVERFLDVCLSLDNLIEVHALGILRRPDCYRHTVEEDPGPPQPARRLPSKPPMDRYINPRGFLEAQQQKLEDEQERKRHVPESPERDVMLFLLEHVPLVDWQRDVLAIVREEAYYFAPLGQTKILNEGWASYWHSTIMTQKALRPGELIDYAEHHAGSMATSPGRLNPDMLGLELLRDLEERWDRGCFGKDWEECDSQEARQKWDRHLGLGREKLFEVRRIYNDIGFIDTFLTPEFARRHKLFSYKCNPITREYVIDSREFEDVKRQLLFSMTNFGQPIMVVQDANYGNRGELLLRHQEGVDLHLAWARETLDNLYTLWNRPVHVETVIDQEPKRLSFDGKKRTEQWL